MDKQKVLNLCCLVNPSVVCATCFTKYCDTCISLGIKMVAQWPSLDIALPKIHCLVCLAKVDGSLDFYRGKLTDINTFDVYVEKIRKLTGYA